MIADDWVSSSSANRVNQLMNFFYSASDHPNSKLFVKYCVHDCRVNTVQDAEKSKKVPNHFSPVTSPKVGVSLKNVLTVSFNPFAILLWNFKALTSTSLNVAWTKTTTQKFVCLVRSLQKLSHSSFSHRYVRVAKLWLHDQTKSTKLFYSGNKDG